MKKIGILFGVLLAVSFLMGCPPDETIIIDNTKDPLGKLIILQAYGNGADDAAPAGVSHSFVELYNKSDKEIDLTNTTLWFADGVRYVVANGVPTKDGEWKSISLNGKKIPAKSSFLILGKKHSAATTADTNYIIPDNSGDINDDKLELSRRGFKVALIYGKNQLSDAYQNPYTDGINDKPIVGYVDMVGAVNNPNESAEGRKDQILGYETAPARNSASEAVRRVDLMDLGDNSEDFESIRYADFSNSQINTYKPRNTSEGEWNPIKTVQIPALTGVDYSKLRINEISGEHKFVEIYNFGTAEIPLYNLKLQRNEGASEWVGEAGDVIPGGAYRLILFNSYTANLIKNPAYTGWRVDSGISDQQILKIALIKPDNEIIDAFVRGNNTDPFPSWGDTTNVERNRIQSYSRMADGSWAYADPTPGAANGTKVRDIVFPGYLTNLRTDPPVISAFSRNIPLPTEDDAVTVSATITTQTTTISSVVIKWTLDGGAESDINMTASGDTYTGTIPKQDNDKVISYTVVAQNNNGDISSISDNYTVLDLSGVDYSPLRLTEVSGEHKYVEIYNSGATDIPMVGVKVDRNDGGSAWTGGAADVIPAGVYRIILFNNYTPASTTAYTGTSTLVNKTKGLETYDEYVGWTVSSGISNQQTLKVAIIDPTGNEISSFSRGVAPWGTTAEVTQVQTHSYSRMSDGTWAYAVPTPGAANGAKVSDIVTPGYTATP